MRRLVWTGLKYESHVPFMICDSPILFTGSRLTQGVDGGSFFDRRGEAQGPPSVFLSQGYLTSLKRVSSSFMSCRSRVLGVGFARMAE